MLKKTHGGEANQTNLDCVKNSTADLGLVIDQPRINYSGISHALITPVSGP